MALSCARSCDACDAAAHRAAPTLPALPAGTARDVVVFSTTEGDIRILLRPDLAPKTAAYVKRCAAAALRSAACRPAPACRR